MGYWLSWDVWGIPLEAAGLALLLVAPFALFEPLRFEWRRRRALRSRRTDPERELKAFARQLARWDGRLPEGLVSPKAD